MKKKKNQMIESRFPPQSLIPPSDLMTRIFSQLDCIDLLQCSLVCKQWYRDSTELREAWKNEYLEAYTRLGLSIKRETHPPSTTCSIRGKGTNEQSERQLSTAVSKAAKGLGIGAAMGWLDWLASPE